MALNRRYFFTALSAGLAVRRAAAAEPEQVDLFLPGEDGYHTYRIPALLVAKSGALLAFAEARKNNRRDHGNLDLVVKRSENGGRTWSKKQIIHEEGGDAEITIGNPCPVLDRAGGDIILPFCRENIDVFVTRSSDEGKSWSAPLEISKQTTTPNWGWYATGPGVGIQIENGPRAGRLVIPCDHRTEPNRQGTTRSHAIYSDDAGRSWKLGQAVADHTNECQVVELPQGRLMMNMRNYWERDGGRPERGKRRAVAYSDNGGETWSGLEFDDTLIEPVCQAGLVRYSWESEGRSRLIFTNPASGEKRHRMTVRVSYDEGKTWPLSKLLHAGPSAYSSPARLKDGSIGMLYERGDGETYDRITFAKFPLAWLESV